MSTDTSVSGVSVGVIGLGLMGKPMALNLLKAGFPVTVFNRSQPAIDELTGLGARAASPDTHVPVQRAHGGAGDGRSGGRGPAAPKRSLVRSAIALLLQQPSLGLALEPPYGFALLRQPGVELLAELVALVRERPDIRTGGLLEHFADRDEAGALQKLAMQAMPGDETAWRAEFLDAMAQLERQTLQQRIDELQAKRAESGLEARDKEELRALLGNLNAARG